MTDWASEHLERTRPDQRAELNLVPHRGAPREARDFLAACCLAWDADRFLDVGGLVLSELVTNVVRHAGTEFRIEVALTGGQLALTVQDRDSRVPYVVPRQERALGGQGMAIVSGLVGEWGVRHVADGGKLVWCRIPDPAAHDLIPDPARPADPGPPRPSSGVGT